MKKAGRPKKAANKANGSVRLKVFSFRCSQSFFDISNHLVNQKLYKSRSDLLHKILKEEAINLVQDPEMIKKIDTI